MLNYTYIFYAFYTHALKFQELSLCGKPPYQRNEGLVSLSLFQVSMSLVLCLSHRYHMDVTYISDYREQSLGLSQIDVLMTVWHPSDTYVISKGPGSNGRNNRGIHKIPNQSLLTRIHPYVPCCVTGSWQKQETHNNQASKRVVWLCWLAAAA